MFLFKSLPQGLFRSEEANSNKLISRCYHVWGTVKFPPGRWQTKQSKNSSDREQASNSERTEVKWRFSKFYAMVLKFVWKLPKSEAQTSQFWIDAHADDRKFGGYGLIMNCPWMQIYPTLYKPKNNPKSSFKS